MPLTEESLREFYSICESCGRTGYEGRTVDPVNDPECLVCLPLRLRVGHRDAEWILHHAMEKLGRLSREIKEYTVKRLVDVNGQTVERTLYVAELRDFDGSLICTGEGLDEFSAHTHLTCTVMDRAVERSQSWPSEMERILRHRPSRRKPPA